MTRDPQLHPPTDDSTSIGPDRPGEALPDPCRLSRRAFVKTLGAGLLITATGGVSRAQGGAPGSTRRGSLAARLHLGRDGAITVMTGKIEMGQGSRAELSQAAAEELAVGVDRITLVMGDTDLCPDDGTTAGSRTTPSTVPAVRKAAATARRLLVDLACKRWQLDTGGVQVRDGAVRHPSGKTISYAELAKASDVGALLDSAAAEDVELTPVNRWKVMGRSVPRPNQGGLVTGTHRFPSDLQRPNMLYGKVLRPPSYGASLTAIDLSAAEGMEGVVVVREGDFVGCAAATSFQAAQAVKALAKTASWQPAPHPPSKQLFSHLKDHARSGGGGRRGSRGGGGRGSVEQGIAEANKVLGGTYEVAYVQHAPMETRAAVAEWTDGKLTVWTGSQAPNRVHSEVAGAMGVPMDRVRVIIPDFGCGFGGKHTGEAAVEAARLARKAGRPVSLQWTREEEFTWAYFRPAALIEIRAGLDADGSLVAWEHTNINSGASAVQSPYEIPNVSAQYVSSDPPLRQGSYRTLAATANNFAREAFMDELAAAAGADPLAFRLAHLREPRLRAVLEKAAREFAFQRRSKQKDASVGVGLACGTEKNSVVAACVEISVDRRRGSIRVLRVCQAFECGPVINPDNLLRQVRGCIIMGLGPALWEEIRFEGGKVLNGNFELYDVPRASDVPPIDVHLLDRSDLPSAGGGETPIIAIAPAIANAVYDAIGVRVRSMPIRIDAEAEA